MSKQAFGLGLAKASAAIAKALGGTATIIFGGDDAELVLDSTSGKYVAPNGSTSLEVPFSPSTSRKNLSASTVEGFGTQSATNFIACDLNGRVPGNAFPNAVLPTPEKDSFVFNGEIYRIVSVETNYVQNVLVEAILYGAKK